MLHIVGLYNHVLITVFLMSRCEKKASVIRTNLAAANVPKIIRPNGRKIFSVIRTNGPGHSYSQLYVTIGGKPPPQTPPSH